MSQNRALITSCDGYTGYYTACAMHKEGTIRHVIAAVSDSNSEFAQDLKKKGVDILEVNPDDANAIEQSLPQNVTHVVLIPDSSAHKVQRTKNYMHAISKKGISHSIVVSAVGVEEGAKEGLKTYQMFKEIEEECHKRQVGSVVLLRTAFYMENILLYSDMTKKGFLGVPLEGNDKFVPISVQFDIAPCIAKTLPHVNEHKGKKYNLTGTHEVTSQMLCDVASKVLGKKIEFKKISMEEASKILKEKKYLDPTEAQFLLETYQLVHAGKLTHVSEDLKRLLGRESLSPQEFFEKHKEELAKGSYITAKEE